MTFYGMGSFLLDELAFHKLWIVSEEENNGKVKCREDGFKEEKISAKQNTGISNVKGWSSLLIGIFFVSGIAGIGSYQALYSENAFTPYNDIGYSIQTPETAYIFDQVQPSDVYDKEQLPGDILPESYLLYVYPDILNKKYQGVIKIHLKCVFPTSAIVFHSSQHTISKVKLVDNNNVEVGIKSKYKNDRKQYVVLQLDKELLNGTYYDLIVGFQNVLSYNVNNGIYLTNYLDGNQKQHQMVSTMFESRVARNTYPCFDEPIYKAKFRVIVQHVKDGFIALSNMPEEKKLNVGKSNVETFFKNSLQMSTYLVTFAVTEYSFRELIIDDGIKIRGYAPTERLEETQLALTVAPLALNYYSEKFQIKYMLPKLDLMPVTELVAAAEETWGMMIFLENCLLFKDASIFNMESITKTVSHEIAHQWFGNLVTMKSWSDLWLKESFAAFLQELPISYHYPSWDVKTTYYMENYLASFNADVSKYTHAVAPNITDLSTLESMYDVITYQKGASLLAMIENVMGNENFFDGVRHFLTKYQYSNADAMEFFTTLNASQNKIDLVEFSSKWITTPGFPLVTVVNKEKQMSFYQKQFLYNGDVDSNKTLWLISLSVQFFLNNGLTVNNTLLLDSVQGSIDIPDNTWMYKVNIGANGFYQVNYDENNWKILLSQIRKKHTFFSAVDRSNILNDVLHLSKYNHLSFELSLMFTEYLKKEMHHAPWSIGLSYLNLLREIFFNEPEKVCLESYILEQIEPVIMQLNLKKEHSHVEMKLISIMVSAAVEYNYKPVSIELNNWFLRWLLSADVKIPNNIRSSVLLAGVKYGSVQEWELLFDRFLKAGSYADAELYLLCLASTENTDLLQRLLWYSTNETLVPRNHKISLLSAICKNRKGKFYAQRHVKKEWDDLYNQSKNNIGQLNGLMKGCFGHGKTYSDYGDVLDFMKEKNLGRFQLDALKILEQISLHIKIVNRKDEVFAWIKSVRPSC